MASNHRAGRVGRAFADAHHEIEGFFVTPDA
jgi:hypothetical protein